MRARETLQGSMGVFETRFQLKCDIQGPDSCMIIGGSDLAESCDMPHDPFLDGDIKRTF